ncbi:fungal-specific transcription factor domain-containing protein [Aspergillus pseudonomiae]|uniref:Fungal-specific transcription factor domain-containing protein n=1 Tax=Aspergillus pseudonomiae TaxID=1506151 RepID=A0A5N7DG00_9EURO|nr:fungal-specific transcription factor domain-containing protein [Aspergillus pseudonomiae]KAB8255852.1 fungal-specific transcription factor domain-containing protein [Aspergillus pseudonomiae]KAE8405362.1 fungal-specific transcription factor domain-containing protein [Aspergillus pseudonomiae]
MYDPCYTCRRRRIQCDQSQVPCKKCLKAGLECYDRRPLRWVKGVAIRGRLQGLTVKDASAASVSLATLDRVPRKKSSKKIVSSALVRRDHNDHTDVVENEASLSLALDTGPVSNLDRTSRYYLDYYNDQICKVFIVHDSEENPLRRLISLAVNDSLLLKAVLALAARHRANSGYSFGNAVVEASPDLRQIHQHALVFKHQAIQGLTHALNDPTISEQDTTVASIFLLIFLDLLESGSDKWNFHLEGAKRLITNGQLHEVQAGSSKDPGRTVEQIRKFIIKQIHVIESLGATFVRPKLLSGCTSLDHPESLLNETVEQSFIGCPEYLLHAVQCLSAYRDSMVEPQPQPSTTSNTHMQDITSVLDLIHKFDCYTWASNLPESQKTSSRYLSNLCKLAQSYKLGALIYGQRVLDALLSVTTPQDELVSELIGVIDALRDDGRLLKCVLWPIFVAGLECQSQAQRNFLITSLENFWLDTNCLNVVNAAKALQSYWQKIDKQASSTQWIFDIGDLDHDWLFI